MFRLHGERLWKLPEREITTENRGYWGYREISEEDIAKNGVDEGGCGCGCGGK
jgi:hypothetical protein